MALDGTYSGLIETIAGWLDRDDLTARIPDFITLAEVRLNDNLRLAPMETLLTVTPTVSSLTIDGVLVDPETGATLIDPVTGDILTDAGSVASVTVSTAPLPDDFLEMRSVTANTSPQRTLRLTAPDWATTNYGGLSYYYPDVYTIVSGRLAIYPQTTSTLSFIYYAKIPALSIDNPSNWLLTSRPNIYLYASLLEAVPYLYDDNRAGGWATALTQAITDAESADTRLRWGNATMRLPGPVV